MSNENTVSNVHPSVAEFLTKYHSLNEELNKANRLLESQHAMIATLEDQIDDMRNMVRETSATSDYYMRLCVEMRTHFIAMQAINKEAERCFASGPYRNNGAVSKEVLRTQMVADDLHKIYDVPPSEDEKKDIEARMRQLAEPVETKIDQVIQQNAPFAPKAAETSKDNQPIPSFLTDNGNGNGKKKGKGGWLVEANK